MKKIFVFMTGLMLFSSPVFAQKLGSFSNPNASGTAGAFAVYTPQEIQQLEEAGQDETVSVQNVGERERGQRTRRRPNFWVLSGGQPTLQEEDEMYGSLSNDSEQDIAKEENKKDAYSEAKQEKTAVMQQKTSVEDSEISSSVTDPQATSASSETSAEEGSTGNEQTASEKSEENLSEGDLVCRKYEKCAICERKKPFWNGRECASARAIKKMQKHDKSFTPKSKNAGNNKNKTAKEAKVNQSAASASTQESRDQNASAVSGKKGNESKISLYNADGTPKTKRQLRKEQREARKAAAKDKK